METEVQAIERQIQETLNYIATETRNLNNLNQRLDAFQFKLADLKKKESEVQLQNEEF